MLPLLKQLNPALVWVRQDFSVGIELVNGHHIFARFDLDSCGTAGYVFDTSFILSEYGEVILDGREDLETHLYVNEIAEAIADVLNSKKEIKAQEIYRQAELSVKVEYALSLEDKITALTHLDELLDSLNNEEYRASTAAQELWGGWLELAVKLASIGSSSE